VFESFTYEQIMDDILAEAPTGVDTRQGSIFFDAVSAVATRIAKLYTDLDLVFDLSQLDSAGGENLDIKASEYGITRNSATPAKYRFVYSGNTPDAGERFFYDGVYFILRKSTDGVLYLECEENGTAHNYYIEGTSVTPVNNIDGLTSASVGEVYENGTDEEDDETLRARVQAKISGPAENGNKLHYKTWCESNDSVGIARIIPLWNGPNTVKAVLIDKEGLPCGDLTVEQVQNYVDPAEKGYKVIVDGVEYKVGDGLGEGAANLGAHFTAVAAKRVDINVSAKIELASGYDVSTAQQDARSAIKTYLQELVLDTESEDDIIVRVSSIGAALSGLPDILDYSDLTVNGDTINIKPGDDGVPVVGEVAFDAV
jgi:uncharacterized phage protein gp47/JayE